MFLKSSRITALFLLEGIILWIFYRMMDRFTPLLFGIAVVIIVSISLYFLSKSDKPLWIGFVIILAGPWLFRILLWLFVAFAANFTTEFDFLLLNVDANLLHLPLITIFLLTNLFIVYKDDFWGWSALILGSTAALISFFIPKETFSDLTQVELVTRFWLTIIIVVLSFVLAFGSKYASRRKKKKKVNNIVYKIIFFALLIPLLLLMQKLYSENSVTSGGGLMQSDLFRFDFDDYLGLESEIEVGDDLVLLMQMDGELTEYLTRRYILTGYDPANGFFKDPEHSWDTKENLFPETIVPDGPIKIADNLSQSRFENLQRYYLVNMNPSALLGMNYPIEILPYKSWEDSSFVRIYEVNSKVFDPDNRSRLIRITDFDLPDDIYNYYTDYGNQQQYKDLAANITEGMNRPYSKARSIENWLKNNFYYSLNPGVAADGKQLDYFLFESQKGYCSYFAFAMTLLCRAEGIPARVAVGFIIDEKNMQMGFYPILENQAHAWVEVYFNEYGWISFDPTSNNLLPEENFSQAQIAPDELSKLVQEALDNRDLELEEPGEYTPQVGERMWLRAAIQSLADRYKLFLVSAAVLYLIILIWGKSGFSIFKAKALNSRVITLFTRYQRRASILGIKRKHGETPLDWSKRVMAKTGWDLTPITNLYLQTLYGPVIKKSEKRMVYSAVQSTRSSYTNINFFLRLLLILYPIPQLLRPFGKRALLREQKRSKK